MSIETNDYPRLSFGVLKARVFSGPSTPDSRPYLVAYIKRLSESVSSLSGAALYDDNSAGHLLATDITAAILHHLLASEEGAGWLTEASDPPLAHVYDLATRLDGTPSQPTVWTELIDAIDALE